MLRGPEFRGMSAESCGHTGLAVQKSCMLTCPDFVFIVLTLYSRLLVIQCNVQITLRDDVECAQNSSHVKH